MSESNKAVFLSYASQDAAAAARICEALRAAGIEVWFDQSELRGGDAWDRQIRRQIHECALFVPIISASSQARLEGYFRREWRLAVERSHDMADSRTFIVPVVIDDTQDKDAEVPDSFRAVQWTRIPGGETPPAFGERVRVVLGGGGTPTVRMQTDGKVAPANVPGKPARQRKAVTIGAVLAAFVVAWVVWRVTMPKVGPSTAAPIIAAASEKSIAVLPFVNMSSDKDQEYFADGLSEELIDQLSKIPTLRIPARTSSFYFKGKSDDIATIAKRLHVAHILEGSVRRSGNRLRVTVQLIQADNGYHVWSETYDRTWDDVFKVQDDITAAVVKALEISLLGRPAPQSIKAKNSEAYALYLQGRVVSRAGNSNSDQRSLALLERAVKLDPDFSPAWALLSQVRVTLYSDYKNGLFQEARDQAYFEAHRAVGINPASAEGHIAMGRIFMFMDWNWREAEREMRIAQQLDGNNADVLRNASFLSMTLGRFEEAMRRIHAATERDPLDANNFYWLAALQYYSGTFDQAAATYQLSLALDPGEDWAHTALARTRLALGQPTAALAEIDHESDRIHRAFFLPVVLDALGRTVEADRARAGAESQYAGQFPFRIGQMYAEHRDLARAFAWWNRAFEQHDIDLTYLKATPAEILMPQLAADPRFRALLKKLSLPET